MTIESRLRKSIEQYRRVVEHAEQLEGLLSGGEPEELKSYTARLNELQAEAGLHDQQLLAEMARDIDAWKASPLFTERMQLLKQIMEMNDLLLPRVRGMMSVTAAELAQLKGGRAAVAGYRPVAKPPRGSLRGIG